MRACAPCSALRDPSGCDVEHDRIAVELRRDRLVPQHDARASASVRSRIGHRSGDRRALRGRRRELPPRRGPGAGFDQRAAARPGRRSLRLVVRRRCDGRDDVPDRRDRDDGPPPALPERHRCGGLVPDRARSPQPATGRSAAPRRTLATQLPVYTGLVEAARANNRQGFPVGAAYLRRASDLMRTTLLNAAEDVYTVEAHRTNADYKTGTANGRLTALAIVAVVFVLLLAVVAVRGRAVHQSDPERSARRRDGPRRGLAVWIVAGLVSEQNALASAQRQRLGLGPGAVGGARPDRYGHSATTASRSSPGAATRRASPTSSGRWSRCAARTRPRRPARAGRDCGTAPQRGAGAPLRSMLAQVRGGAPPSRGERAQPATSTRRRHLCRRRGSARRRSQPHARDHDTAAASGGS